MRKEKPIDNIRFVIIDTRRADESKVAGGARTSLPKNMEGQKEVQEV